MILSKFIEKLNKLDNNTYVIEEKVSPINGVYESELEHDNVNLKTLNVYTGSKLTGDKIETYFTSTPSLTPWKNVIKIFSTITPFYISYETQGDTVEANDINNVQDAIIDTQNNLNSEITRATNAESVLTTNLNSEVTRAKGVESAETTRATTAENTLTNNLSAEVTRATGAETTLTTNLNAEISRAKSAESTLTTSLNSEITRATAKESELGVAIDNRYTKNLVYTKDEVLAKIESLINNAPTVLDTFKEIADALGNDPNFATTMTTVLSTKVDKVTGKALSTNDYTDSEKANVSDSNDKKHIHSNKSIIDTITQALIDNWNSAYTHISDAVKHITATERTLWNTVSNKLDSTSNAVSASKWATARTLTLNGDVTGSSSVDGSANVSITATVADDSHNHTASTITDFLDTVRATAMTGVSVVTNSVITATDTVLTAIGKLQAQITTNLSTLTTHTSNKSNPHGVTASQLSLGNVTNESKATMFTSPALTGVPTAPTAVSGTSTTQVATTAFVATGLTGKANSSHTHAKSEITDFPTAVSAFTNDNGYITASDVDTSQNHTHSNKTVLDGITSALITTWNTVASKLDATANAVSASKWATARTVTLAGDISGSVSIDGSANVTLTATVADDSHAHIIGNVDGLQSALDLKSPIASPTFTGTVTAPLFKSTQATGTAPFTIASTTLNTNLNADMLDGYHATTASTANTIAVSDANNNITATKFTGALAGNATTATTLATARTINGVSFNGSVNITITDDTKVTKGCTWNNLMGV